ncbi:two-component sensor histidine kinase [Rhodanobacter panaciterrae]|uniref:histidine kinase n=2 Tax=Rhodanobacter panaciterrae TaxID=490572 RepID=A0ABQ2ZSS1_9GAMM|nr:two-component sensor histidine kinase [Rhodanobacter panaciterrae]
MLSSLRARLRWLIVLVLVAVLLPLGLLSFQRTIREVDELLDGRLAQSARTLQVLIEHAGIDSLRGDAGPGIRVPSEPAHASAMKRHGYTHEPEVGFQVFDKAGRVVLATTNLAVLPPPQPGDADFRDVRQGGYNWRVFTLADQVDGVVIRTGERYDSRQEITQALWFDHGLSLLLGLPLLALLVGWAVKRGLRPLEALTRALASRELGSRAPIVLERTPLELQPVLGALNDRLQRLADALEREQRFSADVAHELRTPLASTMINLESAQATTDPTEAAASLTSAQHVVAALARRIEQLLALARLESGAASGQYAAVDLVAIAVDVIEELAPVIAEGGVELSFVRSSEQVIVQGYEAALAALLRNLVENAMRHVPAGGQVQLSIEQGVQDVVLDVIDDGPGIPPEHRAQVFTRFHREASSRGEGYGLGLSIVQRAAELHRATIELLDSPFGNGLRVRVVIPLRQA